MSVGFSADLTQGLKKVAFDNHVNLIGVSGVEVFDDIPVSERPKGVLDDAKAVIVYGVRYEDSICWFNENWCSQTQKLLARIDKKLTEFLTKKGYKAYTFRTEGNPRHHCEEIIETSLPPEVKERSATYQRRQSLLKRIARRRKLYSKLQASAVSAGLGCSGKNGMIITPQYGPCVYLTMIITNAPLKPDEPCDKDFCADCDLCLRACPTGACTGKGHSFGLSKCKPTECHFTCHRVCYERITQIAATREPKP